MSKLKPKSILTHLDENTLIKTEVLEAKAVWVIYYLDKPFNLKTTTSNNIIRYKKISFPNPGHAFNLAKKLNHQFKTTDFTVHKIDYV